MRSIREPCGDKYVKHSPVTCKWQQMAYSSSRRDSGNSPCNSSACIVHEIARTQSNYDADVEYMQFTGATGYLLASSVQIGLGPHRQRVHHSRQVSGGRFHDLSAADFQTNAHTCFRGTSTTKQVPKGATVTNQTTKFACGNIQFHNHKPRQVRATHRNFACSALHSYRCVRSRPSRTQCTNVG